MMSEVCHIALTAKLAQEMVENAGGFTSQGLSAAARLLAKQTQKSRALNKATKMLRALNEAYAIQRHFTSNGSAKWIAELKVALGCLHAKSSETESTCEESERRPATLRRRHSLRGKRGRPSNCETDTLYG